MATMKISNKRVRDLQRTVHLVGGLLLAAYVYTPLPDLPAAGPLVRLIALPVLILTGIAMWQLPRLRRFLLVRAGLRA